ncbi:hypothetical protein EDB87DRAFT_1820471 [Lactarius vividus]|nr:hypothetical protein EDB87DRAFT_1820471 [Lactarius vividus]
MSLNWGRMDPGRPNPHTGFWFDWQCRAAGASVAALAVDLECRYRNGLSWIPLFWWRSARLLSEPPQFSLTSITPSSHTGPGGDDLSLSGLYPNNRRPAQARNDPKMRPSIAQALGFGTPIVHSQDASMSGVPEEERKGDDENGDATAADVTLHGRAKKSYGTTFSCFGSSTVLSKPTTTHSERCKRARRWTTEEKRRREEEERMLAAQREQEQREKEEPERTSREERKDGLAEHQWCARVRGTRASMRAGAVARGVSRPAPASTTVAGNQTGALSGTALGPSKTANCIFIAGHKPTSGQTAVKTNIPFHLYRTCV